MMKKIGFQCCVCTEGIVEDKIDPLNINVMFNEDWQKNKRTSQDFYAHFDCFKSILHKSVAGYFIKEDD